LLFFKKFTEQEAEQWGAIAIKAENEITRTYRLRSEPIVIKLNLKGKDAPTLEEKKQLRIELKQIEDAISSETRAQIKKEFNYQIPIAEVEKAGISSTGSQIENELEPLAKEFKTYREKSKLWTMKSNGISYQIKGKEIERIKVIDGVNSRPEIFYGN